jgi:hypothetical protein
MDYDYQTFIKAGSCHSAPFLGMQAVLRTGSLAVADKKLL